ncbi:phosphate ABC transporter permease [Halapricum hydrolyticum]|uniref:Phosphate ABC transporter permease n=1 Tax=Halapricum hydrolyticum TaxID=2979991 RepID=A0AAE3I881_9EURY|nr:phosphate ABC transporter permease [Halapricum hydrolyticum]MCU4716952.1 phosphate ABC transporter permease [Halapricum hydrolyticum]MCU4725443.1 phosphate ABC transporter permease [Halapricum hydrolyticum]
MTRVATADALPELRSLDVDTRLVAGVFGLAGAAGLLVARVALNANLASGVAGSMGTLQLLATLGPALGALVVATATDDAPERIGLAFVGVFGLLAAIVPAATTAAVVAVVAGGSLAVARRWRQVDRSLDWHALPVVALVSAVAVSLAAGIGVASATLWPIGTNLALLGAAATPALLGHGRTDWAFGGLVAAVLVAIGLSAPFVTGAVTLIGGGVVGASLLVLAVGLAGLTTTASAAARTRHWHALLGAGLLFAAGVPASLPRALAVVLGVLLLVERRGGVSA